MEVPVIVPIGSDIMAGFLAKLCDVPAADLFRWYGLAGLSLTAWPVTAPMSGVRSWLHKLPYATVEERNITAATSSTVTVDGTPLVTPTDVGTWIWISSNAAGQGQYRRITAITGGGLVLTLHALLNPLLTDEGSGFGKLKIIRDSHRIASGTTLSVVTKHADTPAFTSAVVGKFALFFHAYDGNIAQLTRKITAQTSTTITLDLPLLGGGDALPVDSGFAVLTGANAVQDLAGATNGAALVPFGLNLDDAPVYSTGQDRCYTGDMGTAFASPLHELGIKATVASATSSSVTASSPVFSTTQDVGALIKVGSQTRRITVVQSATTVDVDLAWSPVPGASDRIILVRSTVNCVAQLAWRMRQRFAQPMVVLELGTTGARVSPLVLSPATTTSSWMHSVTSLDFCPSSGSGLYQVLKAAMLSCKTLIQAEGNTAKFYVCVNCADNDAQAPHYSSIGTNMKVLRDALRADLSDPSMPFVVAGPSTYGQGPPDLRPDIYTQLAAMKSTDGWTSYLDTRDGIAKASDGLHLSAAGQITLADRFADTLIEVLDRGGVLPDVASFVVEDGTGMATATSLCTVEFANAYLQDYEDPPAWRNATTKKKRDALRRMSRWVTHNRRYVGQRINGDQSMAFPRFGLVDEEGFVISHTTVPARVQQATAYGAWRIVDGTWDPFPDEPQDGGLVSESVSVGPISISSSYAGAKQFQTETRLPIVDQLLSIYTIPSNPVRLGRG